MVGERENRGGWELMEVGGGGNRGEGIEVGGGNRGGELIEVGGGGNRGEGIEVGGGNRGGWWRELDGKRAKTLNVIHNGVLYNRGHHARLVNRDVASYTCHLEDKVPVCLRELEHAVSTQSSP